MDRCPSCDMELEPREEGWAQCPLCGDTLTDFKVPDSIAPEVDADPAPPPAPSNSVAAPPPPPPPGVSAAPAPPPPGISVAAASEPPMAAGFELPPGPTDPGLLPELDMADPDIAHPIPPADAPPRERSMPELADIIAASRAKPPEPNGAAPPRPKAAAASIPEEITDVSEDTAVSAEPGAPDARATRESAVGSVPQIDLPDPESEPSARITARARPMLDPPLEVSSTPEAEAPAPKPRSRRRTRLGRVVFLAALLFAAIAAAYLGRTAYTTARKFAPLLGGCRYIPCKSGLAHTPVADAPSASPNSAEPASEIDSAASDAPDSDTDAPESVAEPTASPSAFGTAPPVAPVPATSPAPAPKHPSTGP